MAAMQVARGNNGRFGVERLGHPGIEEIARLDGEVVVARHITNKMVRVPALAPIWAVNIFRPDVGLPVDPGRYGGLPRCLIVILPGLITCLHFQNSLPATLGII